MKYNWDKMKLSDAQISLKSLKEAFELHKDSEELIEKCAVEQIQDSLKKLTEKLELADATLIETSQNIKNVRSNWDKLEGYTKDILGIQEQIDDLSGKEESKDKIEVLEESKSQLIFEYLELLGEEGIIEKEAVKNQFKIGFIPLHAEVLKMLQANRETLKLAKMQIKVNMFGIFETIKASEGIKYKFEEIWKSDFEKSKSSKEIKEFLNSYNMTEHGRYDFYRYMQIMQKVFQYKPEKISKEFINKESLKVHSELKSTLENLKEKMELMKKLDEIKIDSNEELSKGVLASKDKIDWAKEVKECMEDPSKERVLATKQKLQQSIEKTKGKLLLIIEQNKLINKVSNLVDIKFDKSEMVKDMYQ